MTASVTNHLEKPINLSFIFSNSRTPSPHFPSPRSFFFQKQQLLRKKNNKFFKLRREEQRFFAEGVLLLERNL